MSPSFSTVISISIAIELYVTLQKCSNMLKFVDCKQILMAVLAVIVGSMAAKDSTVSARSRYYHGGAYSQPDYYGGAAGSHGAVYPLANNQYGGGYVPVVQPPNYYGGSYGSHQHHQPTSPYGPSYPGSSNGFYGSPFPSTYGTNPAYGNSPY